MLAEYYRQRAAEYHGFYADPERQPDLALLRDWMAARTHNRSVLEVACGTGYWTAVAASTAAAITATDINTEMLAIAARRTPDPTVTWTPTDAFDLRPLPGRFDCGMAHLWWSHLPVQQRAAFLAGLATRLEPGAMLLMIDENLVAQVGAPISRRDRDGNSYQRRRLQNGEVFEIIKNYPDTTALEHDVGSTCTMIEVLQLRHFWALSAKFR